MSASPALLADRPAPPAAPAARAAAPQRQRDVDGFRGFAALTVVVFHAWQFCRAGGQPAFAGTAAARVLGSFDGMISWFFVTSAFLLYGSVVRRVLAGEATERPRAFLLRRALRVLPVYWLAVVLVWAYRNPGLPGDWRDLLEHLTLTQTFDSRRVFYTIGPAWTLSAEVAFYVVVALQLVLARRSTGWTRTRARRLAFLIAPAALLLVVGTAYRGAQLAAGVPFDHWAVWFNPVGWAGDFALGMLLAVVVGLRAGRPLAPRPLRAVQLGAAGLVLGSLALPHGTPSTFVLFHDLSALGYALLLGCSALAPASSWWRRVLSWRPLVWVGVLSFSVYVWHEPLLLLLDRHGLLSHDPSAFPAVALAMVGVAVCGGWLAFRLVEVPLRSVASTVDGRGRLRSYYEAP